MSEMVTLPGGQQLPMPQVLMMAKAIEECEGRAHWHFNDCGCCVTVHGADCCWLIGPDGDFDFFPERGCDCPPEEDE
jgi:hypothetical protein